jgi:penicillin-binding protein-related factor A (putative recombinase)
MFLSKIRQKHIILSTREKRLRSVPPFRSLKKEDCMKEKVIENKIKAYLKTIDGLYFFKEHGGLYGTAGVPDIICCYKGKFIAFEVKAPDGKTTVLQDATIKRIRGAGGSAYVVRSVEEVKSIINSK